MCNLPIPQVPAAAIESTAVISGKLLAADTSPAEAIIELRQYFNELAEHQKFIGVAWSQHYGVGLEIRDPMNARMQSAIAQVSAMICMIESQLKILERAKQAVQKSSLIGEAAGVRHV